MTCNDCVNGNLYCENKDNGFRDCKKVEERCVNFREREKIIYKPLKIGDKVYKYGEEFEVYYIQYTEDGFGRGFRFFATDSEPPLINDDIDFFDCDIGETVFLNRKDSE